MLCIRLNLHFQTPCSRIEGMERRKRILTQRQKEVLATIKTFIIEHGESPTTKELRTLIKVKSLRSVTQYLESLEKKGLIQRNRYKKRNIELVEEKRNTPSTVTLPVFASAGCDNANVLAQETYDEYITVDKKFVNDTDKFVAIRAIGGSMRDAGINDGDYVLVKITENVSENDRIVAIIGGMAVVKKINFTENAIILNPEAKGYKPIIMKEDFKIFGKVIDVIKMKPQDDYIFEPIKENY